MGKLLQFQTEILLEIGQIVLSPEMGKGEFDGNLVHLFMCKFWRRNECLKTKRRRKKGIYALSSYHLIKEIYFRLHKKQCCSGINFLAFPSYAMTILQKIKKLNILSSIIKFS